MEITQIPSEVLRRLRDDPTFFVRRLLRKEPTLYQRFILHDRSRRIIVRGGRQIGKSQSIAWKTIHYACTNPR